MAVVGHAFLKIMPSLAGLGDDVRGAVNRAERDAPKLTIATTVRATDLRAQIRAAVRETDDQNVTIPAQADTTRAQQDLTRLRREESGRSIDLRVVLDKSLGATLRGLSALDNGVNRSTASITRHTVTVGAATLRYAALAAVAGQLVTVLGGLASTAATASGSLLLLPAAGIAAAVALNVLKLGTQGFGDALAEADPAKFAEAVATMPPSMRATAEAVRALQDGFDGLKLDVQQRLFAELAAEVDDLGSLYLPVMRQGLADMADSLNIGARGFASWAREARTVDDVRTILDNSALSMGKLSSGVAPVLSGLRDIAVVGSDFLPALASGLADGAARFGDFIAQARESGQLRQWISAGLSVLGELFTLLGNLARIIGTVFAAADAGGATLLGTLNALTGGLAAFLSSAEGQTALQQIFGGLGAVARALLPVLLAIGQAVVTYVAPAIAALGPVIAGAFGVLVQAAAPAGQILAALAPLAGTAAQALASLLVPVLNLLAGVVAELAPAVSQLVSELVGGALADGVRELAPALIELARAAAPLIVQLGQLLVDAVKVAAPALSSLLAVLTPIASEIGKSLLTALAAVLPLVGQLADLWSQVLLAALQAALPVLPAIVTVVQQLAEVLGTGLAAATPTLVQIGQLLGETLSTAIVGLLPLLPPLAEAWLKIWSEGLLPLSPILLELVSALLPSAIELITALLPVILQAADLLATWTAAIALVTADFTDKLIPVLKFLLDEVVIPVFKSLVDVVSGALQFLQGILDFAMGVITGDWSRAWSGVQDILGGAWRAVTGVVDLATGGLVSFIAGLPRRMLDALGDLGGLLVEAGKSIIRGLLRGIESAFQSVKDKLAQLTNLLPSWKGPPARDVVLLRGNGSLIMRGLLDGLEAEEPAVRAYLGGLTDAIPGSAPGSSRAPVPVASNGFPVSAQSGERPVTTADLAAFLDAVRDLADRPIVVQVGPTEIARATAEGTRVLSRR